VLIQFDIVETFGRFFACEVFQKIPEMRETAVFSSNRTPERFYFSPTSPIFSIDSDLVSDE